MKPVLAPIGSLKFQKKFQISVKPVPAIIGSVYLLKTSRKPCETGSGDYRDWKDPMLTSPGVGTLRAPGLGTQRAPGLGPQRASGHRGHRDSGQNERRDSGHSAIRDKAGVVIRETAGVGTRDTAGLGTPRRGGTRDAAGLGTVLLRLRHKRGGRKNGWSSKKKCVMEGA